MTPRERFPIRAITEPRRPQVRPEEVDGAIRKAIDEQDILGRLKELEVRFEASAQHGATKADVSEEVRGLEAKIQQVQGSTQKQTVTIMVAAIVVSVSVLALAGTLALALIRTVWQGAALPS